MCLAGGGKPAMARDNSPDPNRGHTMPRMIAARNPNATIVANAVNLAVISIGSLLHAGCGNPH